MSRNAVTNPDRKRELRSVSIPKEAAQILEPGSKAYRMGRVTVPLSQLEELREKYERAYDHDPNSNTSIRGVLADLRALVGLEYWENLPGLDVEVIRSDNGRVLRVQGTREDLDLLAGVYLASGLFEGYGPQ